jgi:hypothetical protein
VPDVLHQGYCFLQEGLLIANEVINIHSIGADHIVNQLAIRVLIVRQIPVALAYKGLIVLQIDQFYFSEFVPPAV